MARASRRRRRLWDTYSFPGFRPEPTVRGIFGDPKARVITLKRRSKKRLAAVVFSCSWGGTTAGCVVSLVFSAARRGYFWHLGCGASSSPPYGRFSGYCALLVW